MLRLGVLTTGRQDWGILRSTCVLARASSAIELVLLAGGMALAPEHGHAAALMAAEGTPPDDCLAWPVDPATPIHEQSAIALRAIGDALPRHRIQALLVAGDRFETMAAAVAATLARVHLIHLHGGEDTVGAIDNALRHAITKLAHLHLVSHAAHAARVVAMGEDPDTVHVVGAPGLDNLHRHDLPSFASLEERVGQSLPRPLVVVTLHPATLGADPAIEVASVLAAMKAVPATYVITLPNNDPGASIIRDRLRDAAEAEPEWVAVESLGERLFWTLLKNADAMLGNSSSAIIEAPALGLPAVNVGSRQRGRLRARNVIDVEPDPASVTAGLLRALDPGFRVTLSEEAASAFGDGRSAERVLPILEAWRPGALPMKTWPACRA